MLFSLTPFFINSENEVWSGFEGLNVALLLRKMCSALITFLLATLGGVASRGRAQCGRRGFLEIEEISNFWELCNEGMLRKQGPTDSLTTYVILFWDLLSLTLPVEIFHDMHFGAYRYNFGIVISKTVVRESSNLIVHP